MKLGSFVDATGFAREDAQRRPHDAEAFERLAWSQLHSGNLKDALASAGKAVSLGGGARALFIEALAYERLGDRVHMLADLEKASDIDARYRMFLDKARRGDKLFDPQAGDNSGLLDGVAAERSAPSRAPWVPIALAIAGLLALIGAGIGARAAWRRFSPSARKLRAAQALADAVLGSDPAAPPRSVKAAAAAGDSADPFLRKYRMGISLGSGGLGPVWEATNIALERTVAVKQIRVAENAVGMAWRARIASEARAAAALQHPGIAGIYEISDQPPSLRIVYEFSRGKTLRRILSERRSLPLTLVDQLMRPLCEALAHAHDRGLAHRNLTPGNVLVTEQGHVKLLDFGLSPAWAQANSLGRPGVYAAPESVGGSWLVGGDVYSLAACVYELLLGSSPFGGAVSPGAKRVYAPLLGKVPGVGAELDRLLLECLDERVASRPANARQFMSRWEALSGAAAVS